MIGAVLVVVAILAIPPMVLMTGMVIAAVLDHALASDAEARYEGSELLDLHR